MPRLDSSWAVSGPSWDQFGAFWAILGPPWKKSFQETAVQICRRGCLAASVDFGFLRGPVSRPGSFSDHYFGPSCRPVSRQFLDQLRAHYGDHFRVKMGSNSGSFFKALGDYLEPSWEHCWLSWELLGKPGVPKTSEKQYKTDVFKNVCYRGHLECFWTPPAFSLGNLGPQKGSKIQ